MTKVRLKNIMIMTVTVIFMVIKMIVIVTVISVVMKMIMMAMAILMAITITIIIVILMAITMVLKMIIICVIFPKVYYCTTYSTDKLLDIPWCQFEFSALSKPITSRGKSTVVPDIRCNRPFSSHYICWLSSE